MLRLRLSIPAALLLALLLLCTQQLGLRHGLGHALVQRDSLGALASGLGAQAQPFAMGAATASPDTDGNPDGGNNGPADHGSCALCLALAGLLGAAAVAVLRWWLAQLASSRPPRAVARHRATPRGRAHPARAPPVFQA